MDKYNVCYVDAVWARGKNLQRLNTIEMYYYVNTNDEFVIQYDFHKIDLETWKKVMEIHKEGCNTELYDEFKNKIEKIVDDRNYYTFLLKSKDFNLFRNISLILFLKKDDWNNMEEQLILNTIEKQGI